MVNLKLKWRVKDMNMMNAYFMSHFAFWGVESEVFSINLKQKSLKLIADFYAGSLKEVAAHGIFILIRSCYILVSIF